MKTEDYPALFRAADAASAKAQSTYLLCTKLFGLLTIGGAGLAAYGIESREAAVWAAVLFLGGLFLSIYLAFKRLESTWYRARAVAESIKTATWRFIMRAEPFAEPPIGGARQDFKSLLLRIIREHKELGEYLGGHIAAQDQITAEMLRVRALSFEERRAIYITDRIDEQREWYAGKSQINQTQGRVWFGVFIAFQAGAILFTILRVAYPTWRFWPTEVFVAGAAIVLAWTQTKRFRELATAYGLTAHEIGLAKDDASDVASDETLGGFVAQTESVFSREHTQWVARKDDW
jgi:hypothetical protein